MTREADTVLIITPAYNEAANLAELHRRLAQALDTARINWLWLLVDDCSSDETPAVMGALAARDARVGAIRLACRAGSHEAILAGLRVGAAMPVTGAAAALAADLQDPPEALPGLVAQWRQGAELVFAIRTGAARGPLLRRLATRAIYTLVRRAVAPGGFPPGASDMAVFGRRALEALVRDRRPLGNIFVRAAKLRLLTAAVRVPKDARWRGTSGWSRAALVAFAAATIGEAFGLRAGRAQEDAAAAERVGWARAR